LVQVVAGKNIDRIFATWEKANTGFLALLIVKLANGRYEVRDGKDNRPIGSGRSIAQAASMAARREDQAFADGQ